MAYNEYSLKKEHRKQYRRTKLIDKSCRNHGDCPWCQGNRRHKFKVLRLKINELLREFENQ